MDDRKTKECNTDKMKVKSIPSKNHFVTLILILLTFLFICIPFGMGPFHLFGQTPTKINLEKFPVKKTHKKPVVAIIGENQYTELTDFLIPYGVLKRAEIAEVLLIAPNKGRLDMFPTLSIEITTSIADFDSLYPEGADIVIVPAIHNSNNKIIIHWIQNQNNLGATIVGICDGVWTLAHAGLLKDKYATGHWYSLPDLSKSFKDTIWTKNKRYLQDKDVITTAGVTASLPISLAIVESIAGFRKAKDIARELGISNWDSTHNSDVFHFGWDEYSTAAMNLTFIWNYETIEIPIYQGIDEISVALVADAYSRTYKSKAMVVTSPNQSIVTKSGIRFVSDANKEDQNQGVLSKKIAKETKPVDELKKTLLEIENRYGLKTLRFVTTQMEYPTF